MATLCLPSAIEFHVLGDVVHCGVRAADWYAAMGLEVPDGADDAMRGAWDDEGRFYPLGWAITAWWAGYNRVQRAAYRRRRAAPFPVRGGPVLGFRGPHGGM